MVNTNTIDVITATTRRNSKKGKAYERLMELKDTYVELLAEIVDLIESGLLKENVLVKCYSKELLYNFQRINLGQSSYDMVNTAELNSYIIHAKTKIAITRGYVEIARNEDIQAITVR